MKLDSRIRAELLKAYPAQRKDIGVYLRFLRAAPEPVIGDTAHAHHILPKGRFPRFADLRRCPWNQRLLFVRDHRRVHRLLRVVETYAPSVRVMNPKNKNKNKKLVVSVALDQWQQLMRIRADELVTVSASIRAAIKDYLERKKK